MRPRPILKTPWHDPFPSPLSALPFLHSPHVHFPPTPTLADTRLTHSSTAYDRAPIIVSHNTCELPGRGERVYAASVPAPLPLPVSLPLTSVHPRALPSHRSDHQHRQPVGSYFHPRAFEAYEHQREPSLERRQYPMAMASEAPQDPPRKRFLRHSPSSSSSSSTSSSSSSTTDLSVPDPYTYTELVPLPTYPYIPGPGNEFEFEVEAQPHGSAAGTGSDRNPLTIPAETEEAKAAAARRKRKMRDKYDKALPVYGGTGHSIRTGDANRNTQARSSPSDLSLDGCLGGF